MIFHNAYIYGANSITKFAGKVVFYGWDPPWAPTGVKEPWSLNTQVLKLFSHLCMGVHLDQFILR